MPVNARFCTLALSQTAAFRRGAHMPALREILTTHAPLLLIDAASARVQVGMLGPGTSARWASAEEEAGTGLFRCLEQLGVDPDLPAAFAFCEGPGSLLGIRTTAMAIRTWLALRPRPVFAYQSLAIVAHALARPHVSVISDARRNAWHCTTVDTTGHLLALRRLPTADLSGPLVTPEGFRHWSALPAGSVETTRYDLETLLPTVADADLFRATAEPDAYLHEEPSYLTWTPKVHQAPSTS